MFFLGLRTLDTTIPHFGALTELVVVQHPELRALAGIGHLAALEMLVVAETGLDRLADLDGCVALRRLHLFQNRLTSLAGLPALPQLEELVLDRNALAALAPLPALPALRRLSVAGNRLTRVGAAVAPLTALAELNVAGNLLADPADLLRLAALPLLTALWVHDPDFPANPLAAAAAAGSGGGDAAAAAYTYLLPWALPQLTQLDGCALDAPGTRDALAAWAAARAEVDATARRALRLGELLARAASAQPRAAALAEQWLALRPVYRERLALRQRLATLPAEAGGETGATLRADVDKLDAFLEAKERELEAWAAAGETEPLAPRQAAQFQLRLAVRVAGFPPLLVAAAAAAAAAPHD